MAQKAIHVNLAPTDPKNIAAGDDAAILSGIIGSALASSSGILAFGERLNLSKVTDNSVKVSSGIYLNQGHAVRVTSDEVLTVLSGTQGKQRIDLIVSEYRKGAERDTHVIKTIQGSLFDADPEAPSLQAENLHGAGTVRQEEIGRIVFNGTSIASVAKTAKTISGLVELADSIADHNHDAKYLGKTDKAADSAKLDGYEQSGENTPSTIVRRTSYGTVHATEFAEDGTPISAKYLGKTAKATDSAKLDGKDSTAFQLISKLMESIKTGEMRVVYGDAYDIGESFKGYSNFIVFTKNGTPSNKWCLVINTPYSQYSSSTITDYYQFAIAIDGSYLATRESKPGSSWTSWNYITKTLYGTGAPPSSLLPGQIYVQY